MFGLRRQIEKRGLETGVVNLEGGGFSNGRSFWKISRKVTSWAEDKVRELITKKQPA